MTPSVKLKEIIEGLAFLSDEVRSYLNCETGTVVSITDEELRAAEEDAPLGDFPEWEHEALRIAKDILETAHYLALPDEFAINEYRIMERFCYWIDDDDTRDALGDAIRNRGAFRRFQDRIREYGIADDWYQYRDGALREIALDWCEVHGIQYTE